jgi:hypothetical protein
MEEKMMTKLEFEDAVNAWGEKVKNKMKSILSSNTHGRGALSKSLKVIVKEDTKTNSHSVSFKFHHYGVFRAYGVGRGWKFVGGSTRRWSEADERVSSLLKHRGYTKKEIDEYVNLYSVPDKSGKERKPLDWFDSAIRENIYELGDIASHYYADFSMENLLDVFNRMTISSNYKLVINGKQ